MPLNHYQATNPSYNQGSLFHGKVKSHGRKKIYQKREIRHDVLTGGGTVGSHPYFSNAVVRDRYISTSGKSDDGQNDVWL